MKLAYGNSETRNVNAHVLADNGVLNVLCDKSDLLCGLVVRFSGCRSRDSCYIPGATRFSEK
jgi:hypothetical protein